MVADRSFGPAVSLGLSAAGLAALAGTRTWETVDADAAGVKVAQPVSESVSGSGVAPLVAALALVALAGWGVVLVTRGQVRRTVAVLGLLASLGSAAAAFAAWGERSPWFHLSYVAALLCAAAFGVAVVRAPQWPSMGSRYDAPGSRRDEPTGEEDLWRALDEGRDPTS